MGNGSSQSVVLGSPRLQSSYPLPHNGYQCHQRGGVPRFAHPQNRVLPKPVAGQRLRSTDNGSILQAAGTIRGPRLENGGREQAADPEVLGILRRRSEMIEREDDDRRSNLRSHARMFHSDPDIARRSSPEEGCERAAEEVKGHDSCGNRRSCGGVANRMKHHKKKQRAPEPPPVGGSNSLPRQLERRGERPGPRNNGNLPCKCVNKSKAPQPPAASQPPPPPPLPSAAATTTRTRIGGRAPDERWNSPEVTRAVECSGGGKPGYEKNVHPLDKWRNYRSTGDVRFDEREGEDPPSSRTTVFSSKAVQQKQQQQQPGGKAKIPSYLPQDPFQKEIQAVTKKIAESKQEKQPGEVGKGIPKAPLPEANKSQKTPPAKTAVPSAGTKQGRDGSPPKFYFAYKEVFKKDAKVGNKMDGEPSKNIQKQGKASENATKSNNHLSARPSETTTVDEIVPSLQRFSPSRQQYKAQSRGSTPTLAQKAERGWDDLSRNLYNKQDEDSDIDIRLRPVLPRKPLEMPKFSPAEAWQALGSDGLSSNQSTSDDSHEAISPFKKNSFVTGDNRRSSEVPYSMYEKMTNAYKVRSMSDSHWTPRQDLLDDSDVSSIGSEEAVVPRIRPNSIDIPTRFSLPSVMFSNMRPIGADYAANGMSYFGDNARTKHNKKKPSKFSENENRVGNNFKKFLSKRNKFEEDVAVSDSNWTFGQSGLHKRGKLYSSDLMLSDSKKHEWMTRNNFSEILGDILVNKANDYRSQIKSSDSGNSNFSFYSTEGQVFFTPEKGGFVQENSNQCSPPTRGRVYDIRRRFDPNLESPTKPNNWVKNTKKKAPSQSDLDLGRRRDLELAKMLEDEVRKRRNREKISIRQQLQKMKNMTTDDDEEDEFDDEAYFTEPKSREESQSPFFQSPGPSSSHFQGGPPVLGHKPFRFSRVGKGVTTSDSAHLSHWQSSPALLEDVVSKNGLRPVPKGNFSSSSVMSSPDPEVWAQHRGGRVDSWLQKQRNLADPGRRHLGSVPILEHSPSVGNGLSMTVTDNANDGDISSSPTPAPQKKKERRKTNIYKQLMDIVRKEERQLRNNQQGNDPGTRNSSHSQTESSPSSSSEASSLSSAYSYSDSSGSKSHGKNGVSADKEFHTSGYTNSATQNAAAQSYQAFLQPYTPSKSYRPVPFDVISSPKAGPKITG